jgi:hypothetical protein
LQSKVPLRVAFFTCSVALGKILTIDNLRKRNLIVIDWCCMCKKSEKTIDYFLLHYEVARALWNFVFVLCELRVGYDLKGRKSLCKLERIVW